MIAATGLQHAAGRAFDRIADHYDELFTSTPIGQLQRDVVWAQASAIFLPGSRVLELNCGTGTDAMFLASKGVTVTACDASSEMIERAELRKQRQAPGAPVEFRVLANERLHELVAEPAYDGVLSNFAGLNCTANLSTVFDLLAMRLRPRAKLLLCLSTRFCVWEILHYSFQGKFRKAMRRWRGVSEASLEGRSFSVYYPTIRSLRNAFEPAFELRSVTGVGIAVPPSYLNQFMGRYPRILEALRRFDAMVCKLPVFRVAGDHMLLHLERV